MNRFETRTLPLIFLQDLWALEAAYLKEDDPIRQSGFRGGADRWGLWEQFGRSAAY